MITAANCFNCLRCNASGLEHVLKLLDTLLLSPLLRFVFHPLQPEYHSPSRRKNGSRPKRELFCFFFFHHLHQAVDLSFLCLIIIINVTLKQQQHSYFGVISIIIWKVLPARWLGAGRIPVDGQETATVIISLSLPLSLSSLKDQLGTRHCDRPRACYKYDLLSVFRELRSSREC